MKKEVWILDDDASIRWVLEKAIGGEGLPTRTFERAQEVLAAMTVEQPGLLITDVRMPGMTGWDLLKTWQEKTPHIPVIVTTAHSDLDSAVAAFQGGAFEYLPKPFDIDEVARMVHKALHSGEPVAASAPTLSDLDKHILGIAPAMQEVFRAIGRLAGSQVNVLITGESGTGKELVAQALHRHSPRGHGPFIALNTAAIPAELLESELFGHEKGAFTGAVSARPGRFEQADGGALFLDEIGDMPLVLQTRLLRVLADGTFFRVGGQQMMHVNVRVIAATHQNLESLVAQGKFREDLFHRLNVIRLRLPSLWERKEDIPLLAGHFLKRLAEEMRLEQKQLSSGAVEVLQHFSWPGNVRQLENVCRWITVMSPSAVVHVEDLPPEVLGGEVNVEVTVKPKALAPGDWDQLLMSWARQELAADGENLLAEALPRFERALILSALEKSAGHKQDAARLIGWGRNTLTRKLKEFGMESEEG